MRETIFGIIGTGLILAFIGILSSKKFDMARFYEKVNYCCSFPNNVSINDYGDVIEFAISFNQVLEDPFAFREDFQEEFIGYYRRYREWLLSCYFKPDFRFAKNYDNCFSWRKKKEWNTANFRNIYGAVAKQELFFAQSFHEFSKGDFYSRHNYHISQVECKMRLGALLMLKAIGYSWLEDEIRETKQLFYKAETQKQ